MNVSITNECNRRCEYCFQKSWYLANNKNDIKEMSVDTFKELLSWSESEPGFNILGGEPLLHSNIDEILISARDASRYISIISNLIIPHEKILHLVNNYSRKPIYNWLANTDYLDTQEQIFLKNISVIKNTNISLSSTLLPDIRKINKSLKRMKETINHINNDICDVNIRLSPTTPNHLDLYKVNFFDYTDYIIKYIESLWKYKKYIIEFDCHINYCEVNMDKLENHFKNDFDKYIIYHSDLCDNGAFDVLVDGSVIWCNSCRHIGIDNFRDYSNIFSCRNELYRQWKNYWKNTSLKCNFRECNKFNPAKCSGLCSGRNYIIDNQS